METKQLEKEKEQLEQDKKTLKKKLEDDQRDNQSLKTKTQNLEKLVSTLKVGRKNEVDFMRVEYGYTCEWDPKKNEGIFSIGGEHSDGTRKKVIAESTAGKTLNSHWLLHISS